MAAKNLKIAIYNPFMQRRMFYAYNLALKG